MNVRQFENYCQHADKRADVSRLRSGHADWIEMNYTKGISHFGLRCRTANQTWHYLWWHEGTLHTGVLGPTESAVSACEGMEALLEFEELTERSISESLGLEILVEKDTDPYYLPSS